MRVNARKRPRPSQSGRGRSGQCRQRRSEVAFRHDFHALQAEPGLHQAEFLQQFGGGLGRCAGLGIGGEHAQHAGRAVGLDVDARDDGVAEQEGQDVVAVLPLFGRRVDLDAVAEIEQALGARALEDQRVERGEQGAGVDPARQAGVPVQIGRLLPALDARPAAVRLPRPVPPAAPSCRRATGGNSRAGRHRWRCRARGPRCAAIRGGRRRRAGTGASKMSLRDDALGQVVEALEAAARMRW